MSCRPLQLSRRSAERTPVPERGRYPSRGIYLTVTPPQRLRFELSHLAASEAPVFTAIHDLHLTDRGQRTQLNLTIRVTAASPAAPAAVAGIQPGWEQLLSKLTRTLTRGTQHRPRARKR